MSHVHGDPECRQLFARLSEYLDRELDAADCAAIERHMEDCPPCQTFLESLRRTIGLIRDEGSARLPDDLRREILDRGV